MSAPAIEVKLSVAAATIGSTPAVTVAVINRGDRALWFVGVLDGSETATRYPHYLPRIASGGRAVAAPPMGEDPLVSPLRLADFRLLQPGESFDPTRREGGAAWLPLSTFATFRVEVAGDYEFELTVSSASQSPEQWLGKFNQEEHREVVLARIAGVPRLTVRSNIARVRLG